LITEAVICSSMLMMFDLFFLSRKDSASRGKKQSLF
jgi:hypothetical protein